MSDLASAPAHLIENGYLYRHTGTGNAWGWTFVKKVASIKENGVANVTVARADLGSPTAITAVTQTDPPKNTSDPLVFALSAVVPSPTTTTTAAATTSTTKIPATTTTKAATTTTRAATTTTRAATTTSKVATTTTVATSTTTTSLVAGSAVTTVQVQSTGNGTQSDVPVSFGQVFAVGDVPAGDSVTGKLADGSALPLQVDAKARHPDGSLRHAVISAVLPQLAAGQTQTLGLAKTAALRHRRQLRPPR